MSLVHAFPFRVRAPLAGFHAIVAENDGDLRRLVAEALEKDGCTVAKAEDGAKLATLLAADRAGSLHADLIVTDVRMPKRDGLTVVEALRAAGWTGPIIVMTAFADAAAHAHARRLGAFLLDKPFELDDLRTLAAWLLSDTTVAIALAFATGRRTTR